MSTTSVVDREHEFEISKGISVQDVFDTLSKRDQFQCIRELKEQVDINNIDIHELDEMNFSLEEQYKFEHFLKVKDDYGLDEFIKMVPGRSK